MGGLRKKYLVLNELIFDTLYVNEYVELTAVHFYLSGFLVEDIFIRYYSFNLY